MYGEAIFAGSVWESMLLLRSFVLQFATSGVSNVCV